MPLDKNNIQSIKIKNKPLSTILSIGIPLIVVVGAIWINIEYGNADLY